jgi:hypothetical protein
MTFKFNEPINIADCYRIRILHKGNLTDKLIIYLWKNEYTVIIWTYWSCTVLNSYALVSLLLLWHQILSTRLKRNVADLIAFDFRLWRCAIQERHFQRKSTFGFLPEFWLRDVNFDFVMISSSNSCADGTQLCVYSYIHWVVHFNMYNFSEKIVHFS